MSIRLDERRYVEELKRLVADFRMWKNPLVPLPDGFEDDLAWRSYRVFGQTNRLNPSKPSSQESRGFNHGSVKSIAPLLFPIAPDPCVPEERNGRGRAMRPSPAVPVRRQQTTMMSGSSTLASR